MVLATRLTAQLLAGRPARSPLEVVDRLLAVQAQDLRGARLAIRARTSGVDAGDVDRALTEERSLLVTWLNRGTLHLVRCEDYPWLQALTTPPTVRGNATRLAQLGVTPALADRGVRAVERALADEGPLTRRRLGEHVAAAGVPTEGQALVHVLIATCLRGLAVRGPVVRHEQAYALVRDWLGPQPAVPREAALAELALRFLAGHGPATDRDLAKWAGLPLRDARIGLDAIAPKLVQRRDGAVDLAGRRRAAPLPPPRLLGAFDPVLHGWTSRAPVLAGHDARVVSGGLFRPFALVRGRGVGIWALRGGEFELELLEQLPPEEVAALERDGAAVRRFLGLDAAKKAPRGSRP